MSSTTKKPQKESTWSIGLVELWSVGYFLQDHYPRTPVLHYSTLLIFHKVGLIGPNANLSAMPSSNQKEGLLMQTLFSSYKMIKGIRRDMLPDQ
jgi:hypothetical protein